MTSDDTKPGGPDPTPFADTVARPTDRDGRGRFLPGNVAAETHGVHTLARRGRRPPAAAVKAAAIATVQALVDDFIEAYKADLGADVTTAQAELLNALRTVAIARRLVELDINARGLMTARGRKRASADLLLALVDREERLIKLLGLKRQPRDVPYDIETWMKQQV